MPRIYKIGATYSHGCVLSEFPATSDLGKMLANARKQIDPNDLAGDGIDVGGDHVTLRYGVKPNTSIKGITDYLQTESAFKVRLGPVTSFPPSESSEKTAPLIIKVYAPELHRMNERLGEVGTFKAADFEYTPHITIAYVKPEAVGKYTSLIQTEGKETWVRSASVNMPEDISIRIELKNPYMVKQAGPSTPTVDSEAFKSWFSGSKVVDANGSPQRVFRGDYRGDQFGHTFKDSKSISGGFFFTESPEVASSYATGKPDTHHIEENYDYAKWFTFPSLKYKGEKRGPNLNIAWYRLNEQQRQKVIAVLKTTQLDDQQELVFDADGPICSTEALEYEVRKKRGDWLAAGAEIWLTSGSIFGEEQQFLKVLSAMGLHADFDNPSDPRSTVTAVYLRITKPLNTSDVPDNVINRIRQEAKRDRTKSNPNREQWTAGGMCLKQWVEELENDLAHGTSFVWTTLPKKLIQVLQSMGYDGIKDTGGKNGGDSHAVWIAFNPYQIKSAIGNNGKFDPTKKNITAAEDVPSNPAFKSWFGRSEVINADGTPKMVYHGTGADIDSFQYEFAGLGNDQLGSGFYFTDNESTASGYASDQVGSDRAKPGGFQANVMPVYLSLKKPIHVTNDAAKERSLTLEQVKQIILASPNLDDSLTNFGDADFEGKDKVIRKAVSLYTGDLLTQLFLLANDFFRDYVQEFNEAVHNVTGYDGVVANTGGERHYVAWFPNQIKSAIGNNGNFDPKNHSIIASKIARAIPSFEEYVASHGGIKPLVQEEHDDWDYMEEEAEEQGRTPEEIALEYYLPTYKTWLSFLNGLTFPRKVYRMIALPNIDKLRYEKIGVYWALDENTASIYGYEDGGDDYLLEAEITENDVDWPGTLDVRMYPNTGEGEDEIRLISGSSIHLTRYRRVEGDKQWVSVGKVVTASIESSTKFADGPTQDQNWDMSITETPAFRAWFRKSKVVDDHGRPLRMFHGTRQSFDSFSPEFSNKDALMGPGFYFTANPEVASGNGKYTDPKDIMNAAVWNQAGYAWQANSFELPTPTKSQMNYAKRLFTTNTYIADAHADIGTRENRNEGIRAWQAGPDEFVKWVANKAPAEFRMKLYKSKDKDPKLLSTRPQTVAVFLCIEKPFVMESRVTRTEAMRICSYRETQEAAHLDHLFKEGVDAAPADALYQAMWRDLTDKEEVRNYLQKAGYDGINHTGGRILGTIEHPVWIAFEPNQIKSAIGNDGGYSRMKKEITSAYKFSSPKDLMEYANDQGISLFLHEYSGYLTISKIVVPKEQRGNGKGTQIMQAILQYADAHDLTIALTPDTTFGGSKGRLVSFYTNLGFVRNTGRNKDFRVRETMLRTPHKTASTKALFLQRPKW
jgi:2'-5' RNA ligase/predicted GNAT family N-acyltransferase